MARPILAASMLSVLLIACPAAQRVAEEDDDGEAVAGVCGDGVVNESESCDDGNQLAGDGCSAFCQTEEVCDDGSDNDGDGDIDCTDRDCQTHVACGGEDCDDGEDNDGNGLSDCDDPACSENEACIGASEDCGQPGDEDGNGLADCDDPVCADDPACADPAEDCATPGDEDGNGLADCDDPACEGDPNCGVCGDGRVEGAEACDDGESNGDDPNACRGDCTLPVCGDGVVDDAYEERCDQGLLNNDGAPNMCRADCSWPSCGDGVVDDENPDPEALVPSEACDGDDNCDPACQFLDPASACPEGAVVIDLAGFPVLDEAGAPITDTYSAVADISWGDGVLDPVIGCTPEDDGGESMGTGGEVVFLFTPQTDGYFEVSIGGPLTDLNGLLYWRTACDSPGTEVCVDGQTSLLSASAGQPHFLVADALEGWVGTVQLTVRPVETSGVGEPCDGARVCLEAECVNMEGAAICVADPGPVQDSFEVDIVDLVIGDPDCLGADLWTMRFRSTGRDQNRDIEQAEIELLGGAGETFFFVNPIYYVTAYDGDAYEAEAFVTTCDPTSGVFEPDVPAFIALRGGVIDSAGHVSDLIEVDLFAVTQLPIVGVGEPCDPSGVADVCVEGAFCQNQGDGSWLCGTESSAPTLDEVELVRITPSELRLMASGNDLNGDVTGLEVRITDTSGAIDITDQLTGGAASLFLPWDGSVDGAIDWHGATTVFINPSVELAEVIVGVELVSPGRLYARAIDGPGNTSSEEVFVEIPAWVLGAEGDPCALEGTGSYCAPEASCEPTGLGDGVCTTAPFELLECWTEDVDGVLVVSFRWNAGPAPLVDPLDSAVDFLLDIHAGTLYEQTVWVLDFLDFQGLSGQFEVGFGGLEGFVGPQTTHVNCHLATGNGETSNYARADIGETAGFGASCVPSVAPLCAHNLACVTDTCEVNTDPTIVDAVLTRDSLTSVGLAIDVVDAEANLASSYRVGWKWPDGMPMIIPEFLFPVPFASPVAGVTSAEGLVIDTDFGDVGVPPEDIWPLIEFVTVEIYDISGAVFRVDVNVNLAAGEACLDTADAIPCQWGLVCLAGTCQ